MTGITCVNCYIANATQVLRSGSFCVECYTYIKGVTND
jgi:protein-arginine kinase activator protein McsA